ncbi:SMI1/KNR4 family protein [Kribbella sp. NPDC050459]|uniref:SMI1/KNR4 family protein n=1 Tax=Kribbella sp. NPDC050459 TaxID=3155785 RepID=UPI0034036B35
MSDITHVLELLSEAHPAPEEVRRGATDDELVQLEVDLGTPFPAELLEWLRACRGTTAGPGGLYGVGKDPECLDIAYILDGFPAWRAKGWIPVAGDGNGNYFVLTSESNGNPVGFVEPMETEEEIQFYVASNLFIFLREILANEVARTGWPFDAAYISGVDPDLLSLSPLPWS